MNNFIHSVKKVSFTQNITRSHLQKIEDEYNVLINTIADKALTIPEELKQFVKHSFNELEYHHKKYFIHIISKYRKDLDEEVINVREDKNRGTDFLDEIEGKFNILKGIAGYIEDTLAMLLEHLIAYYPDEFGTDINRAYLKELAPFSLINTEESTISIPQPLKTKADILRGQLSKYGFFELEKIKTLSEQSKISIIEKIAESGLPYAIAMLDYLQFISYLQKNHFDTKYKLNKEVSKWFDSDKEGRAVKGNISSLLKNTTENKNRYTAHKHKENVIKDYEQLK